MAFVIRHRRGHGQADSAAEPRVRPGAARAARRAVGHGRRGWGRPVAKRALVADNAKKLQGQTATQVVALASAHARLADDANLLQGKTADALVALAQTKSVSSFFTLKQGMFSMPQAPHSGAAATLDLTLPCDAGQKAISGGFQFA
jgi:hypothetical protein